MALILRLAEGVEDELDFGGGEAAAAQVAQVAKRGVEGDPLAELVPGCLGAELGEVGLGELRAPEGSRFGIHLRLCLIDDAKLRKNFENNE